MKKVNVFQMLLLGVVSLFFSCKNQINLADLKVPEEECRLSFSIGDTDRTVKGTLTWAVIKEIVLFKDGETLASWESDENETAYQKMTSDDSILLESGTYDFTIDLKTDETTVIASGSLLQKKIETGLNPLNFTTEQKTEGIGNISLTFNWSKDIRVTKATAALYTLEDVKVADTEKVLTLKTMGENTVVTYKLADIPSGVYVYKLSLYEISNALMKTCTDAIIVENKITSSAEITVTGINILNRISYVLNGGSWSSKYSPPFSLNDSQTIKLPTRSNIARTNYGFSGWYDNPEFSGEEIYKLSDETRGDITLYAKWSQIISPSARGPGETVYVSSDITTWNLKESGSFIEWEAKGNSIGSNQNFERLTKLYVSNSVTSITSNAFLDCANLKEVFFDNGIKSLNTGIFSRCSSLKRVTLPSTLTSIGDWAFDLNLSLEEIEIPDSVTTFGNYVFQGCVKLENIKLSKNLKTIGQLCFDNCPSLKSITIPASVTSIDADAFRGCDSLTEVIYEGTLEQWLKIRFTSPMSNPCYYSRKLICNNKEISGDIVIPDSVKTLSGYTFVSCDGITSITIPAGVTSIGPGFATGNDIKKIIVDPNNTKYDSRDNCNGIIGTSTNTLISGAKITTIPDSVTEILPRAYAGCYGIETIESLPHTKNGTTIDYSYLPGIKRIVIPETTKTIPNNAFVGCIGLESVEIPSSVTSIGLYAFGCCGGLKEVTILGSAIIGERAFYGCTSLNKVTILGANINLDMNSFRNCINLEEISPPTSVGIYAFYGCEKLKNITLAPNARGISEQGFYFCTGLETITIPSSVTSIGSKAFKGCSSLKSIVFENTENWKYNSGSTYDATDPAQNAKNLSSDMAYYIYTFSRSTQ